jgi:hypothetical protein
MTFAKLSVLAAGLLTSVAAFAGTPILSENFNSGFQAGAIPLNNTSDNWAHTGYGAVLNANGWTLGNAVSFATDGAGNGALLLNENGIGRASKQVTGLTAGQTYKLQFNMWGDNIAAAVPEPETYAMLLGGLALLGVAARRKAKRQQA